MCGIIGITGKKKVLAKLISGLKKLEYRGYDSAGVALASETKTHCVKAVGKVSNLEKACRNTKDAETGIAHTRWATHGSPTLENAHPHTSGDYTLVHNGIIENADTLRRKLMSDGFDFYSETDSEVIVKLLDHNKGDMPKTIEALEGSFALAILSQNTPNQITAVKMKSPLAIAQNSDSSAIASDIACLSNDHNQFIFLEDGDIATLNCNKFNITNSGKSVKREFQTITNINAGSSKGNHTTFMTKEILEQEQLLSNLTRNPPQMNITLPLSISNIQIVACGTSYNAGMVSKYWFEDIAKIACNVDIASEYRYRNPVVPAHSLMIVISQSGETADTLAALELAQTFGFESTLAICNVEHSAMTRLADNTILTHAGPEYGVASTKAFTTQLLALLRLTHLLRESNSGGIRMDTDAKLRLCQHDERRDSPDRHPDDAASIRQDPSQVDSITASPICHTGLQSGVQEIAKTLTNKTSTLFIARGSLYPIAIEGALKLKELSYIHAEAYPAGELKHGPLALVDENMPVIALLPDDELFAKTLSNIEEVHARGGDLILIASETLKPKIPSHFKTLYLPPASKEMHPIQFTIPLQLLAFHVATLKGLDVDQPRNLAKSVTVE